MRRFQIVSLIVDRCFMSTGHRDNRYRESTSESEDTAIAHIHVSAEGSLDYWEGTTIRTQTPVYDLAGMVRFFAFDLAKPGELIRGMVSTTKPPSAVRTPRLSFDQPKSNPKEQAGEITVGGTYRREPSLHRR